MSKDAGRKHAQIFDEDSSGEEDNEVVDVDEEEETPAPLYSTSNMMEALETLSPYLQPKPSLTTQGVAEWRSIQSAKYRFISEVVTDMKTEDFERLFFVDLDNARGGITLEYMLLVVSCFRQVAKAKREKAFKRLVFKPIKDAETDKDAIVARVVSDIWREYAQKSWTKKKDASSSSLNDDQMTEILLLEHIMMFIPETSFVITKKKQIDVLKSKYSLDWGKSIKKTTAFANQVGNGMLIEACSRAQRHIDVLTSGGVVAPAAGASSTQDSSKNKNREKERGKKDGIARKSRTQDMMKKLKAQHGPVTSTKPSTSTTPAPAPAPSAAAPASRPTTVPSARATARTAPPSRVATNTASAVSGGHYVKSSWGGTKKQSSGGHGSGEYGGGGYGDRHQKPHSWLASSSSSSSQTTKSNTSSWKTRETPNEWGTPGSKSWLDHARKDSVKHLDEPVATTTAARRGDTNGDDNSAAAAKNAVGEEAAASTTDANPAAGNYAPSSNNALLPPPRRRDNEPAFTDDVNNNYVPPRGNWGVAIPYPRRDPNDTAVSTTIKWKRPSARHENGYHRISSDGGDGPGRHQQQQHNQSSSYHHSRGPPQRGGPSPTTTSTHDDTRRGSSGGSDYRRQHHREQNQQYDDRKRAYEGQGRRTGDPAPTQPDRKRGRYNPSPTGGGPPTNAVAGEGGMGRGRGRGLTLPSWMTNSERRGSGGPSPLPPESQPPPQEQIQNNYPPKDVGGPPPRNNNHRRPSPAPQHGVGGAGRGRGRGKDMNLPAWMTQGN